MEALSITEMPCQRLGGLEIVLPPRLLEAVVQELFPLAEWLATMSSAEGPVGIVVAEDMADTEPMVLFVRHRRLYVGTSNPMDAKAADDGSLYCREV